MLAAGDTASKANPAVGAGAGAAAGSGDAAPDASTAADVSIRGGVVGAFGGPPISTKLQDRGKASQTPESEIPQMSGNFLGSGCLVCDQS